jgi:hypothetical protein
MRIISSILLTAILTYVLGLFVPWWSAAVAAFMIALLILQRPGFAFLGGFMGTFLCWIILAFCLDVQNAHILSTKMANAFPLGGNYYILLFITALTPALPSGLAALAASYLRQRK